MSVFAKTRQLIEPVSIARENHIWLTTAVWLAIAGSVLAFGFGRDFERPKALCLCVAAAMLIPRALLIWPTWPRRVRAAAVICLLVLTAVVIFALDPARALIGSFERSQGAFLLVCCSILALARVPAAVIVLPVSVAVCVSGTWAAAQFFGVESAIFSALGLLEPGVSDAGWQRAFGWRAFASFGNPMAMGGWLVIAIVFLFSVRMQLGCIFLNHSKRGARMLDGTLFVGFTGLLLSGTRAACIALAVVVLIQFRQYRLTKIIGLTAMMAVAVALLSFRADSIYARIELAGAALSPAESTLVDGLGRRDPYPAARGWLGYGPDLQVVMLEHNLPQLALSAMPDRVHQMLLDGYLSIGLLGVLSWLGLMLALGFSRVGINNGTLLALLAALITWQFGFALSAEKALFALLLGSMYAPKVHLEASAGAMPAKAYSGWLNVFAGLFATFSILSYMPRSFLSLDTFAPWRRPERAIVHFERARLAIMANQGERAEQELGLALTLDPWRADLARAKATLALALGHTSP